MKRIDSIEKNKKRLKSSFFREQDFFGEQKEDFLKEKILKSSFFNKKKLQSRDPKELMLIGKILLMILAFSFFVDFSVKRAIIVVSGFNVITDSINGSIGTLQKSFNDSDIDGVLEATGKLKVHLTDARRFTESWGQDIQTLRYLGLPKSKLTKKEMALDVALETVNLPDALSSQFSAQRFTGFLNHDGFLVDLAGLRKELNANVTSLQKKISLLSKKLSILNQPETKTLDLKVSQSKVSLADFKRILDEDLPWLSGEDGKDKNIMIIFQNNSELRGGSGGSLGSFGIARFQGGKFKKIDFGINIYKLDAAFKEKEKVDPPEELAAFGDSWTLKQSGFAVDGKEALDKIRWFYEKETNEHVDGVITIDTTAFSDLLEVVGPLDMTKQYGKVIDYKNFKKETETEVQHTYFDRTGGKEENEPKKILGDMMPLFIDRLVKGLDDPKKGKQIAEALLLGVKHKNILFNFSKESLQDQLEAQNVTGQVRKSSGDYLYINNSNLAGGKTNLEMSENVDLSAKIFEDGTVSDNLAITRKHNGTEPDLATGLDRNYIRALIPSGSTVTSFVPLAGNFQRYYDRGYKDGKPFWAGQEAGKSTINFWMSAKPQETVKAQVAYTLPQKISLGDEFNYQIIFQRQPGAPADHITFELNFPKGYHPLNVKNYDFVNNIIFMRFDLETDKEIKIHFGRN